LATLGKETETKSVDSICSPKVANNGKVAALGAAVGGLSSGQAELEPTDGPDPAAEMEGDETFRL
jgi:hypothetical protein